MKLSSQQLEQHLAKTLAPIYIISTDELLLAQDALDQIRAAARKAGFTERQSLTVETGSDWGKLLYAEAHSLSLFATKRIVELHLAGSKPNNAASKILQDIAASPLPDTILIITSNKFDSRTEQTAWHKALEKSGVVLQVWPIPLQQLPTWIMQRAKKAGLQFTPDAAKLLADQVEGNLLAAAQEIEKIGLLQITGVIDHHAIAQAVTDNARFDIFSLVECALSGNSQRCIRILDNLRAEDVEPILILWALAREVRTLADIAKQMKQGAPLNTLFSKFRIWEKRQPSVRRFLQQHSQADCLTLLAHCAKIDRIVKGAQTGNAWDELQLLTLKLTGSVIITN
ncbi:MAG: DNA polymerase III subunit delta [Gammaproteobacteria bacterium]|nr:DNA polymerase III subunit delta [Gammaproteobacteria bacterium]